MSRLLLAALLVLLVPLVAAQAPATATSSLSIENLPTEEIEATSSIQVIPFDVRLTAERLVCLTSSGTFQVTLSAAVSEANTTGNSSITATFSEDVLTFVIGSQEAVQGYSATNQANLVVSAPGVTDTREAEVVVTATLPAGTGGCANAVPAAEAVQTVRIKFGRDPDLLPESNGEAMPGPAFGLLLAAVAVALFFRRK